MNNKLMNGSQMVCESLIREGVEHIFGIPGGAILPLYQVLPEFGIRFASIYCQFSLLYAIAAILYVESTQ